MTKQITTTCSDYVFNKDLDLAIVGKSVDDILLANFKNKKVVIRAIQSQKHELAKNELIERILKYATDRLDAVSKNEVDVCDKPIDIFGYACKINQPPFVLPILEGFHKWKPKSLERPQRRLDVWMIYDAGQLENIEYMHKQYQVKVRDAYKFKDSKNKTKALLGIIVIE